MLHVDPHLHVTDERLTALVYELLDAHDDTTRLATDTDSEIGDIRWQTHLAYLRDLQRVARELLARQAA